MRILLSPPISGPARILAASRGAMRPMRTMDLMRPMRPLGCEVRRNMMRPPDRPFFLQSPPDRADDPFRRR
jgi:hypothetical protein